MTSNHTFGRSVWWNTFRGGRARTIYLREYQRSRYTRCIAPVCTLYVAPRFYRLPLSLFLLKLYSCYFRSFCTLSFPSRPCTWLWGIVRNLSAALFRRRTFRGRRACMKVRKFRPRSFRRSRWSTPSCLLLLETAQRCSWYTLEVLCHLTVHISRPCKLCRSIQFGQSQQRTCQRCSLCK